MKKKRYYIFLIMSVFVFATYVNAEETCSLEDKTNLRSYASNVTVSYVPKEVVKTDTQDNSEYSEYYLDIKIFNLDNNLRVELSDDWITKTVNFDYNDIKEDGSITIREDNPTEIRNLTFNIYGNTSDCYSTSLRTIKLTLPKFNHFSERAICEDIPEYYLCQQFVTYDIDNSTFLDNVNKYKEKKENKGEDGQVEDNTNIVSKAISGVSKYRYLIAGVIIVIGVSITIYVIRKKRSTIQ